MNKKQKKQLFIVLGIVFVLFLIVALSNQNNGITTTGVSPNIKYTVPLMASIRCEKIADGSSAITIGSGASITPSNVGAYTPQINNLKVNIQQSWLNTILLGAFLKGYVRADYKICDINGNSCSSDSYQTLIRGSNNINLPYAYINLNQNSFFLKTQKCYAFGIYCADTSSTGTISYTFDKYGLVMYSPVGVGIGTICQSGCDLNCPNIGVRQKIVQNENDILDFVPPNNVANYISTWVDVSQKSGSLGGTEYNPSNGQFCFGGFIYQSGSTTTEEGQTYVYPNTYLYKKDCCPNAVVTTATSIKTCQSDYTWHTLPINGVIPCSTDFQCPNQGREICQNKKFSGWSCSGYDSTLGNICKQSSLTAVQCCSPNDCATDQTCENHLCKGGGFQPPINWTGNETNGNIPKCSSCEDFALSYLVGSVWKEKSCKPKSLGVDTTPPFLHLWQSPTLCWLALLKLLLVPIALIVSYLYSTQFLERFKQTRKNNLLKIILSIVIAGVIAYIVYVSFIIGIVLFILYLIIAAGFKTGMSYIGMKGG